MLLFGGIINKDYAWDANFLYKYRYFSDGVDFFECKCSLDLYKSSHTPAFDFTLRMFNFTLVEFKIYYRHHREEEN